MAQRIGLGMLALALAAAPAPGAALAAPGLAAEIDGLMEARGLMSPTAPGCAVSVTRAGARVFAKAYGSADLEQGTPFALDTVSETGSVAKQFTAAAIFMLAEEGRLSLDDDIRRHLPEMPDHGEVIRISDLIHQTSGIREWSTLAALRGYPRFYKTIYDMPELVRLMAAQRTLNFRPGTRYEYSNSNYALATIIVERVSGISAAEFGRTRIFEPLGMTSTRWRDDLRQVVPRRAVAYRPRGQGFEQYMPHENIIGHGAMLSTVGDLQRWNQALLSGRLSPYVTGQLTARGRLRDGQARNYAGGIIITERGGRPLWRHGGVTAGYNAQLWALPDAGLSFAMLCNVRPGDGVEIAGRALDAALGLPAAPQHSAVPPLPPLTAAPAYYRAENGEMAALYEEAGAAELDLFTRSGRIRLEAGDDGWRGQTPFGAVEAARDARDLLTVQIEGREAIAFRRAAIAPASAVDWAGRYQGNDLDATYDVRRTSDGYRVSLVDPHAPDPLVFRLERLTGDTYFARIDTRSGYLRDDFVITFVAAAAGEPSRFVLSSVAGLQAVDGLMFSRTGD